VASTRVVQAGQPVQVAKPAPATEGLYRKLGQIYRVSMASGRRLYAQRLDRYVDTDGRTAWRYVPAPGLATRLSMADRMDVDEAVEFGKLTFTCVRCARPLSLPDSLARGMGYTCWTKTR
jgi:hypothetical protein